MRKPTVVAVVVTCALIGASAVMGSAPTPQLPFAPSTGAGSTVTPSFEGWYENPDGTYALSFGYYNRNTEEILEIPLGPENFMEPAEFDGDQPTRFHARQHWGVFTVSVPADFGDAKVYWTLKNRGETFSIPGHLKTDWKIDALDGEVDSGNTPPVLRLGDREGAGPGGVTGETLHTTLGERLSVTVAARDDGNGRGSVRRFGEAGVPVTLTWFKHQGPGDVEFSQVTAEVPAAGGEATTLAMFSTAGEYVLRVRANDASGVASAGHAQCCWSNAFVRVTVSE